MYRSRRVDNHGVAIKEHGFRDQKWLDSPFLWMIQNKDMDHCYEPMNMVSSCFFRFSLLNWISMVLQIAKYCTRYEEDQWMLRPLGWNIMESLEHHGIFKFHANFQDVLFALNTKDNQWAALQGRFGGFKPLSFSPLLSVLWSYLTQKKVETTN